MGYLTKAIAGMILFGGGTALVSAALVALFEIPNCVIGDAPYPIASECPAGTGTSILLLLGGAASAIAGAVVLVRCGRPPWRGDHGLQDALRTCLFAWGVGFTIPGAVAVTTVLTNDRLDADGELGAWIVGATFVSLGVPAIAAWLRIAFSERPARDSHRSPFEVRPGG